MDHTLTGAISQLLGSPRGQVSGAPSSARTRNLTLALISLALAFYVGFIVLTIYRSHH
jgi:hypothetical protein